MIPRCCSSVFTTIGGARYYDAYLGVSPCPNVLTVSPPDTKWMVILSAGTRLRRARRSATIAFRTSCPSCGVEAPASSTFEWQFKRKRGQKPALGPRGDDH